jgi:release factor glutamine methyltransferase
MPSLRETIGHAEHFLWTKGIPTARLDSELLLAHVLKCKRFALYLNAEQKIEDLALAEFQSLLTRRSRREPLQYIMGEVEFYGLSIAVNPSVLIPRHETEEFVDLLMSRFGHRSIRSILDLGTGSGAIGLALGKHFPQARVLAVDLGEGALEIASANAVKNGIRNVQFAQSNWFSQVSGKFDIIVSNPPYLSEEEFESAQDEIKIFEPKVALVSANGGLEDIFKIIGGAGKFLERSGVLALETGNSQHGSIAHFAKVHFGTFETVLDLKGQERFAIMQDFIA